MALQRVLRWPSQPYLLYALCMTSPTIIFFSNTRIFSKFSSFTSKAFAIYFINYLFTIAHGFWGFYLCSWLLNSRLPNSNIVFKSNQILFCSSFSNSIDSMAFWISLKLSASLIPLAMKQLLFAKNLYYFADLVLYFLEAIKA